MKDGGSKAIAVLNDTRGANTRQIAVGAEVLLMFGPYSIAHPNEAAGNGLHPLPPLIRDPPKNATGESESQRAISSLSRLKIPAFAPRACPRPTDARW